MVDRQGGQRGAVTRAPRDAGAWSQKTAGNPQRADAAGTEQPFYHWEGETLVLDILGRPAAREDAIGTPLGHQLRVSVTVAPRAGRATDHMVRFLAQAFGVEIDAIEVVFGRKNVNKRLRIHAPKRLPALIAWPRD